jgi:hypothetical protein
MEPVAHEISAGIAYDTESGETLTVPHRRYKPVDFVLRQE